MARLSGRHGALFCAALGFFGAATSCAGDTRDEGGSSANASSNEAASIVASIRASFRSAVLPPSAARIEGSAGRLSPRFDDDPAVEAPARVSLPTRADEATRVADARSGVAVEITLVGARPSAAQIGGGVVLYRGGYEGGADVLHRPTREGTEDYVLFQRAPRAAEVRYTLMPSPEVAGLRVVESTVELLDAGGAPRLRMSPPYLIDARGARHEARAELRGCAHDTDPRAPWGRPVTAAGASSCSLQIRWDHDAITYPALLDPAWATTASMAVARQGHAAAVLATGNVLVAGGFGPIASAEIYNPTTSTWAATGSLAVARTAHTSNLLGTGLVLVAGGQGAGAVTLASAERYDPTAGTWSAAGSIPAARALHTATVLGSGKVLVAGGRAGATYLATTAIYDPTLNTWSAGASMAGARGSHTASLLSTGKVLVAGGYGAGFLASAELYDATANTWASTGAMFSPRYQHAATTLGSGRVLVSGGLIGAAIAGAEMYDPVAGTWAVVPSLSAARYLHTSTLLSNGAVLVSGGLSSASLASAEVFDPTSSTWRSGGTMAAARYAHTASLLGGGSVLVTGGVTASNPITSAERFTLLAGGVACTAAGECASGFCVDGVCCATACVGLCQACSAAKTGGANGTCAPVTVGTDPDGECTALPASTCGTDGACNGAGACRLHASGTTCVPPSCGNGILTTPTCNGVGLCLPQATNCAPYICASASACATSCSNDAQCVPTHHCRLTDNSCQLDLANGLSCTNASECQSGNCVDGVCCDAPCNGLCQACSAAKTGGAAGTCAPVKVGTDPDNECAADPASTCQQDGQCDGAGACRLHGKNVACGSAACNGSLLAGQVCDGFGQCVADVVGSDCAPYRCRPTGCASPCTGDQDCVAGTFCSAGACVTQAPDGSPCTAADQCQSGFCVESICCDTACDGVCQTCTAAEKGSGADGVCGNAKAGADPHDDCAQDGVASCKLDGLCDGNGACSTYAAGTPCAPSACVDNTPTAFLCNGAGACLGVPGTSCKSYLCTVDTCATDCTTAAECAEGSWCNAGACQPFTPQGSACSVGAECASGFCVDGRCCDGACTGQCEACDVAGGEGTCVPLAGAPRGGRPACAAGTAENPCAAASCDGVERTTCAGFVGSAVQCRVGSCVDGVGSLPGVCDGLGSCPELSEVRCEPYACGEALCKTSCASDADCAESYRCEGTTCVLGATCDGDHTVHTGDGKIIDCGAYTCEGNGTCRTTCASIDDCVAPNICLAGGKCAPAAELRFIEVPAGCAASRSGRAGSSGAWLVALLGVALGARLRRARAAAIAAASIGAAACSNAPSASDSTPAPGLDHAASEGARRVVTELRDRFGARLGGLVAKAERVEREGSALRPHVAGARASLVLPTRARGAFHLADGASGVDIEVTLEGAGDAAGEAVDGLVVYPGGYAGGADLVHRATADGTEDYVVFERAPAASEVRYSVALGDRVAGLRLVAGTLEALDAGGAPRLRVAPPYLVDALGARHEASLSVSGCALDRDPRAPWGRATTAPGARRCAVIVTWGAVRYPAVLDPAWTATPNMASPRASHTATPLVTGKVLVAGGLISGPIGASELYDPTTGTWAATGAMLTPRGMHTATSISGSRVLVVAGAGASGDLKTAEIYDPVAGTWASGGTMTLARSSHTASLLASGKVLVAGGATGAGAEVYDPGTNAWSSAGTMIAVRSGHVAATLSNGKVLAAGGFSGASIVATAELYDPGTNTWTAAPSMATGRWFPTATVLPSGLVLVACGATATNVLASAELYNPTTNAWAATGSLVTARYLQTATVVLGKVLVAGGVDFTTGTLASSELYDPTAGTWSAVASMGVPRDSHAAAAIAGGKVLASGGFAEGVPLQSAEVFAFTAAGVACTQPGDCASGFCVDGVCCATACTGLCQACSAAKTGGANGTCANVLTGTDPDGDCTDLGPASCGTNGLCNGAGACQLYAAGTACVPPSCSNGTVTIPACNGTGLCQPNATSCAPYLCADASACGTTCTGDAQCVATSYCRISDATCQPDQANGATCTSGSQCQSGFCVDGVCCNSACGGLCRACSAAKTGGVGGICAPIKDGIDPDNECVADPVATCQRDGQCDGAGACRKYAQGVSCGPTACAGNLVSGQVCDGFGTCTFNGGGVDCAPYLCQSGSCTNPCVDAAQCQAGNYCDQGTCKPKSANGGACTTTEECSSGFCVEGVCCNTACNGVCQSCTAANKASGADGTCDVAKAGVDPHDDCSDDGATSCLGDGSCDGAGACRKYASGTECAPADCANNTPTLHVCNGVGTCLPSPSPASCGDFLCQQGACTKTCVTAAECAPTAWCNAGACEPLIVQGAPCPVNEACATGLCADGVCCNAPCQGQCEACDVTGAEGTCLAVSGVPHGSRAPCAPGDADNPCSKAVCNGNGRTSCDGFVGAEVVCREAGCASGTSVLAVTCDSYGNCPSLGPDNSKECSPFACDTGACKTECVEDTDCAYAFRCDDMGNCIPGACDGDHTVVSGDTAINCSPYRCRKDAQCKTECASVDDCAAPNVCNQEGACVAPRESASALLAGCSAGGGEAPGPRWPAILVVVGLGVAAARRRDRRAHSGIGSTSI